MLNPNTRYSFRRRIELRYLVLVIAAASWACAGVPTGDPERDQVRIMAAQRQAAVIQGASDAARDQDDCEAENENENENENNDNCPSSEPKN